MEKSDNVIRFTEAKNELQRRLQTMASATNASLHRQPLGNGLDFVGLTLDDIFNDSEKKQPKEEFLKNAERGNHSQPFSRVTSHNHQTNSACRERIDHLLSDVRQGKQQQEETTLNGQQDR